VTVSEGELYLIDQQVPRLVWDNRAVGTRQRWVLREPGCAPILVGSNAQEQFLRNDILKDQPPYPAPIPGTPGTPEESKAVNWTMIQWLQSIAP
jgi:hypothetical protein